MMEYLEPPALIVSFFKTVHSVSDTSMVLSVPQESVDMLPVSYTHLDVYKRQVGLSLWRQWHRITIWRVSVVKE